MLTTEENDLMNHTRIESMSRWFKVLKATLAAVEAFDPVKHAVPCEDWISDPDSVALVKLVMDYGCDIGVTEDEAATALQMGLGNWAKR